MIRPSEKEQDIFVKSFVKLSAAKRSRVRRKAIAEYDEGELDISVTTLEKKLTGEELKIFQAMDASKKRSFTAGVMFDGALRVSLGRLGLDIN
jgi:hypothetical protein